MPWQRRADGPHPEGLASRLTARHPAPTLFLLALALGLVPIAFVAAGMLPPAFDQLGALSASAAGFLLAARAGGRRGVRALAGRVLLWRTGLRWWLLGLLLPAVPAVGARIIAGAWRGAPNGLPPVGSPAGFLAALLFLIVFAGLGEEFGWRGFGLPRVQLRHSALTASLIIGSLHALWHVPLFFLEGVDQYEMARQAGFVAAFGGYAVLVIALAVQLTWIFNNTGGSVLLVAVYHGAINAWNGYVGVYGGLLAGAWAYTGLMVATSAVIVMVFGTEHLSRTVRRVTAPLSG